MGEYRCHRCVVSTASHSIGDVLARNKDMTQLDAAVLGVQPDSSQHLYNLLESLYGGDQDSSTLCLETCMSMIQLQMDLKFQAKHQSPVINRLTTIISCDNVSQIYGVAVMSGCHKLKALVLTFVLCNVERLRKFVL